MGVRAYRPSGATYSASVLLREGGVLLVRLRGDATIERGHRIEVGGELDGALKALQRVYAACEAARSRAAELGRDKQKAVRALQRTIGRYHATHRAFRGLGRHVPPVPPRPPRNSRAALILASHAEHLARAPIPGTTGVLCERAARLAHELRAASDAHLTARTVRMRRLEASLRQAKVRAYVAMRRAVYTGQAAHTDAPRHSGYGLQGLRRR